MLNLNLFLLFSIFNIYLSNRADSLNLIVKVLVPNFLYMNAIIHILLYYRLIWNIFAWKLVAFFILTPSALNSILHGSCYFEKKWISLWLVDYWCQILNSHSFKSFNLWNACVSKWIVFISLRILFKACFFHWYVTVSTWIYSLVLILFWSFSLEPVNMGTCIKKILIQFISIFFECCPLIICCLILIIYAFIHFSYCII